MKIIKNIIVILCCIIIFIGVCIFSYFQIYYHADDIAEIYINSNENVNVSKIEDGYYFDGEGDEFALIFYPGAKVETEAYASIMYKLAQNGIDTFLIDMPLRFAFLGKNKATNILNKYDYSKWIISGHSLGGVVATNYLSENYSKFSSIIYLASYPIKNIDNSVKVLSIYGENDNVLSQEAYNEGKKYFSKDFEENVIMGGNHAYFGDYGEQKCDGKATISNEEQQNLTVKYILEFIKKLDY